MRSTKSKNRRSQLPIQVVAAESNRAFRATLNNFFESNDEDGHISFLTELCRVFTGITFDQKSDSIAIANGVFAANVIKDFILEVEEAYLSDLDRMTSKEAELIGEFLDPIGAKTAIEVLNSAIVMWIHPEEPEHTIGYLDLSTEVFSNITEIIRICSRINNHYLFAMEGGLNDD